MNKDKLTIPIATFGKGSKKKKKGKRHPAGGYYLHKPEKTYKKDKPKVMTA